MSKAQRLLAGLVCLTSSVGSLFVKKDPDGKYSVAVAPLSLLFFIGTGATCAVQKSEPFSVCFKETVSFINLASGVQPNANPTH